jgi:hypothetical protein
VLITLSIVVFAQEQTKPSNVKFRGYGYVGTALAKDYALGTADVNLGMSIIGRAFVGIEIGFQTRYVTNYTEFIALSKDIDIEKWKENGLKGEINVDDFQRISITTSKLESYVPIGVNLKAYFTKDTKVVPFFNISFGGLIGCCGKKGVDGLYCQVGAGVDIYRLSLSAGYYGRQVMSGVIEQPSSGYIKVGWRF